MDERPEGRPAWWPNRIISGGQTGVDRAALDVALELGISCGGFCPRGRRAEDGVIPPRYPLSELPSRDYAHRTAANVRCSDATLILHHGTLGGGTALTAELARREGRPLLCIDLAGEPDPEVVRRWLRQLRPAVLNVAGPRESGQPGIRRRASIFLRGVLEADRS